MKKDVVYIDVDDDITAIIEKVKNTDEKIVALVPPKRVGVLQSAVNLRLLMRTAKNSRKNIVLITNNQALMALAASASIPVAKNLQSKPEIPEIAAVQVDDDDDLIDGQQLPVGDHAKTIVKEKVVEREVSGDSKSKSKNSFDDINLDDSALDGEDDTGKKVSFNKKGEAVVQPKKKEKGVKVPNFDSFRNKLFIGIAAGILLIGGLVWAFVFAPAAKVIVTAATTSENISFSVNLTSSGATDVEKNTIQTISKTIEKEVEVEFKATGTDTVGDKATGKMDITRTSVSSLPLNVPAGTQFSSGDYVFVSTESATLDGTQVVPGGWDQDTKTISVQAVAIGADYNLPARSYSSNMSGISAEGGNMSGGSSREVTVVSQEDFDKALDNLDSISDDAAKEELIAEFKNGEIILKDNITIKRDAPKSEPAIGKEATGGDAKVVLKAQYTAMALPKIDVQEFLKSKLEKQIGESDTQRIYDDGIDGVSVSGYFKTEGSETVTIATNGKIGPNITPEFVKQIAKGRSYGDIQADIGRISGVNDVDVQFSYFWVRTVPDDDNKIEVEFKLEDE